MTARKLLFGLFALALFVVALLGGPGVSAGAVGASAPPAWLNRINEFRGAGGLPPVEENGGWSQGALRHSLYMVANSELAHGERTGGHFSSTEGNAAGSHGNVFASSDPYVPDVGVIDAWMASPLHALHLLRPSLRAVGYGIWRDALPPGSFGAAATLDVLHGAVLGARVPRPMAYPYPGAQLPITTTSGLEMCGGGVAGPVSFFFHPQNPTVTGFLVTVNGVAAPLCVVTSGNFLRPGEDPTTWRQMLAADGVVLVIPRDPVPAGSVVNVGLATREFGTTWTNYTVRGDGAVVIPQP